MAEEPTTHKAAIVVRDPTTNTYTFQTTTLPVPTLHPWEILVKLSATGICATDTLLASGLAGPTRPILGHEGVGRIVRLGSGIEGSPSSSSVTTVPGALRVGDRVGIGWVRDACGVCVACREPEGETRCVEQLNSGRKVDGTFAEYCVVPGRYVLRLPDDDAHGGLPDEMVAPILCGGVTAYKALRVAAAAPGSWIAVFGAGGGVGAFAVQYAKAMGYRVAAVDVGPDKRAFCESLGADVFFDGTGSEKDLTVAMKTVSGGVGAKAAIVAAGSAAAYERGLNVLGMFGKLVVVGITPPGHDIHLHPLQIIDNGISIVGVAVGTRTDTLEALEYVRRGEVKPVIVPTTLDKLDEVAKVVNKSTGKYVIRF